MSTENDKPNILQANISILTRGGPFIINTYQQTNPIVLQGIELPVEADYEFRDPSGRQSYATDNPLSIELFFGDNGWDSDDISLGKYQLTNFLPAYADSGKIKLKLIVSAAKILSIAILDHTTQIYRIIVYIDISKLEPPALKPQKEKDFAFDRIIFRPRGQDPDYDTSGGLLNGMEIRYKTKPSISKEISENIKNIYIDSTPRKKGIPRPGKDILQDANVSFDEAVNGAEKEIEVITTKTCLNCNGSGVAPGKDLLLCRTCSGTGYKKDEKQTDKGPVWHMVTCPACNGDGLVLADPCPRCKGNGWVRTTQLITLKIPTLIESGSEICILHQGEPGRYGGSPGHLHISTYVALHPLFSRTGGNIIIHLPVSTTFAKQGGYLMVPDVREGNSFLLKLPADVKGNTTFRVFESEDYTLTGKVEIYHPTFLFAQYETRERIKIIKERLGKAEYELLAIPGIDKVDLPQSGVDQANFQAPPSNFDSTKGAKTSSNQAILYLQRGMIYEKRGDWDRALADYNKALELDPNSASAYDKRGALYLHKNKLNEALVDLNKALELEPTLPDGYTNRGKVYFRQKRYGDAVGDFDRSISLHPGDADLSLLLGQTYFYLGEHDKAITFLKEAINSSQNPRLCRQARLFLAYSKKTPQGEDAQAKETVKPDDYVSLDELYKNAPTNFTDQTVWEKWENEYIGKFVKGEGKLVNVCLQVKAGKIFLIVSLFGEDGMTDEKTRKIAFSVEDIPESVKLGKEEGSFLIGDEKWIRVGENYTFDGRVSEFSLLEDPDLMMAEKRDFIIVKGKKGNFRKIQPLE